MPNHQDDLTALAAAFATWAGENDMLAYPIAPRVARAKAETGTLSEGPERPRPPINVSVLEREVGNDLGRISAVLGEKAIHLIGICPQPRALLIGVSKKIAASDRRTLPRRTATGIELHFEFGAVPEIRLASSAIAPKRTLVMQNGRYPCGSSISLANGVNTGTMGALVEDEEGNVFGLTCNHVTGMCNNTELGLQVVAPGLLDVRPGSLDPFTVGHHARLAELAIGLPDNIRIKDNLDAALFAIADPSAVTSMQKHWFDTPTTILPAMAERMIVEKVGRSSERTSGTLVGWATQIVPAPANVGVFKGTIYFERLLVVIRRGLPFAEPGDSGSLVVTEERGGKRHAVGIVFAVSSDRVKTYVAPIADVLDKLKVKLIGGHNVPSATKPKGVP